MCCEHVIGHLVMYFLHSFNQSDDDGQLKIKATTKRRILSSDEDTTEEEHDKENGGEGKEAIYI